MKKLIFACLAIMTTTMTFAIDEDESTDENAWYPGTPHHHNILPAVPDRDALKTTPGAPRKPTLPQVVHQGGPRARLF